MECSGQSLDDMMSSEISVPGVKPEIALMKKVRDLAMANQQFDPAQKVVVYDTKEDSIEEVKGNWYCARVGSQHLDASGRPVISLLKEIKEAIETTESKEALSVVKNDTYVDIFDDVEHNFCLQIRNTDKGTVYVFIPEAIERGLHINSVAIYNCGDKSKVNVNSHIRWASLVTAWTSGQSSGFEKLAGLGVSMRIAKMRISKDARVEVLRYIKESKEAHKHPKASVKPDTIQNTSALQATNTPSVAPMHTQNNSGGPDTKVVSGTVQASSTSKPSSDNPSNAIRYVSNPTGSQQQKPQSEASSGNGSKVASETTTPKKLSKGKPQSTPVVESKETKKLDHSIHPAKADATPKKKKKKKKSDNGDSLPATPQKTETTPAIQQQQQPPPVVPLSKATKAKVKSKKVDPSPGTHDAPIVQAPVLPKKAVNSKDEGKKGGHNKEVAKKEVAKKEVIKKEVAKKEVPKKEVPKKEVTKKEVTKKGKKRDIDETTPSEASHAKLQKTTHKSGTDVCHQSKETRMLSFTSDLMLLFSKYNIEFK